QTVSRGNGLNTTYTYTAASKVKRESTRSRDNRLVTESTYTYDSHDNVATNETTRVFDGVTVTEVTEYGYDAYDHLVLSSYEGADGTTRKAQYEITVAGDVSEVVL